PPSPPLPYTTLFRSLLHRPTHAVLDFGERRAAGVKIAVGAMPDLAAQQLIERHPGTLGFDVPERNVHAAHRVEQHRPIAPVRAQDRKSTRLNSSHVS